MKKILHKTLFIFLAVSLFGGWFIWGPFCPFCVDADIAGSSCEGSCNTHGLDEHFGSGHGCGSHHQDECRNCSGEFVKLHIHEKFVFTLSDRSRTGENPLTVTALSGKAAAGFQFREIEPVVVASAAVCLSLESLRSVVMLI
ncbi:MAG: hypothetical protein JW746_08725 [Candidatus Krumholzibacteriota bacterium]|nr:hypothetical protein [Candidatus Krumholzibacteriota bacterium]